MLVIRQFFSNQQSLIVYILYVFLQAKFMPYTGDSTIVSCARDGKV